MHTLNLPNHRLFFPRSGDNISVGTLWENVRETNSLVCNVNSDYHRFFQTGTNFVFLSALQVPEFNIVLNQLCARH